MRRRGSRVSRSCTGLRSSLGLLVTDDSRELGRVETRAPDECAVDVGLGHEGVDISGFHAAAIEDADAPGRRVGREADELAADGVVHFLRLPRGRGAARADRPDRLVGDHAPGDLGGRGAGEGARHLPLDDRGGRVGVPLGERLADADGRRELGGEDGVQAAVHRLVGLAEVLAALGVPDDDVRAPRLAQHRRRDLAGVGALRLPVDVLRPETDLRAGNCLGDGLEGREGRGDRHLAAGYAADRLGERSRERHGLASRPVHLPVAGDQRCAIHVSGSVAGSSRARIPGSSRPSRNSSDAPPPVETCVTAASAPARASAAIESPPPTTVVPREAASAAATASVPRLNASTSKMPIGPFQKTVRARAISAEKASVVAGPMSTPSSSGGKSSAETMVVRAPASGRSAATWSTGRSMRTPLAAARASASRATPSLSSSTRERPTGFPWARRKVYAIAPPIQKLWTRPRRFSITPILSETLAPPSTATNGFSGAWRSFERNSTSRSRRKPAVFARKCLAMPAVDAWARCAAPKASFT